MDRDLKFVDVMVDRVIRQSKMAWLFDIHGEEVWLPKSQLDIGELKVGERDIVIGVSSWLCLEKGIEFEE